MKLTTTEFLDRVNRATVAAMEVLAVDKTELTPVNYILLDSEIALKISSEYGRCVDITGPPTD